MPDVTGDRTYDYASVYEVLETAYEATRREVDAPDSFTVSHDPRIAWADGYTKACEDIRAALRKGPLR